MKDRIDKILVEKGLVSTRSKARDLILSGHIKCAGKIVTKPSELVSLTDFIDILTPQIYVGRGALKLKEALDHFKVQVEAKVALDVGASTGGFTQVLLEYGAQKVYAVDVGHGQLDATLKKDPNVKSFEGVNVKFPFELPEKVDVIVVDLSFISLKAVLKNIYSHLKSGGEMITLIKPQFEAGKERVPKDGVIKDNTVLQAVLEDFRFWCKEQSLPLREIIDSPVQGKQGNHEFLGHFK